MDRINAPGLVRKLKRSLRATVVEVEHPAETFTPSHFSNGGANLRSWLDDSTLWPLMVSPPVIILEILADNTTKVIFSDEDHSIRGLALENLPTTSIDDI